MPSKFHKKAIKRITPKERKKAVAILEEVTERHERFSKKQVYPVGMNKIPTQKILRYIDRRIADNKRSEEKLLKEFKGMILAYENEESLKKAMSEMGMIAIARSLERHKKKNKK